MRWEIENEDFNTQKRQGYCLEHQYSKERKLETQKWSKEFYGLMFKETNPKGKKDKIFVLWG